MINNILIFITCCLITLFYKRKNYSLVAILSGIYLLMMPNFKIGESAFNSVYFLTLCLFILIGYDLLKGRIKLQFSILAYLFTMLAVVVIYLLGWFINGNVQLTAGIVSLAGELNYIFAVILLAIIFSIMGQEGARKALIKILSIFLIVNLVFVIGQRFFYDTAYYITYNFYASSGRTAPLDTIGKLGFFLRFNGTFYSPVLLGATCLLLISTLISLYIKDDKKENKMLIGIFVAAVIGVLSLTKTLMIGVLLYMGFALVYTIIKSDKKKKDIISLAVILLVVIFAYSVTYFIVPAKGKSTARYYYSMILKPINSLSSRYAGVGDLLAGQDDKNEGIIESDEETSGITYSAMKVFKDNWLFGVGLTPLEDEFVGDGQITTVLHNGGVLSALLYLIIFGWIFFAAFINKDLLTSSIVFAILITCISSNALTYPFTVPFVAYSIFKSSENMKVPSFMTKCTSKHKQAEES